MPANLVYGLDANKRMVHISKVPNGLDCECICASCGKLLIAKNNPENIIAEHFAHYAGSDCAGALETMVHRLAKQIICDSSYITLPDGTAFNYNSTKAESTFDKYRADVQLKNEKQFLNVEVVVTNGLSLDKEWHLNRGVIDTLIHLEERRLHFTFKEKAAGNKYLSELLGYTYDGSGLYEGFAKILAYPATLHLFRIADKKMLMDKNELKVYHSLPEVLTVYRGGVQIANKKCWFRQDISWPVDQNVAADFAGRRQNAEVGYVPTICKAKISKIGVLAYFDGRHAQSSKIDQLIPAQTDQHFCWRKIA